MKNNSPLKETPIYLTIKEWNEDERPREKLLQQGEQSLTIAELLAILIRSGFRGSNALDIAKYVMQERSLSQLAKQSVADLKNLKVAVSSKGNDIFLGETRAIVLKAALELANRIKGEKQEREKKFLNPEQIFEHFRGKLSHLQHEEFHILLLDSANNYIADKRITQGILNASLVHPREVFSVAVSERAASIVLCHNHPSKNTEPSSDDIKITKQLVEAGKIMDIPVCDHIIIAGDFYTSFVERRLI
jgi:DNA repair protein RadC